MERKTPRKGLTTAAKDPSKAIYNLLERLYYIKSHSFRDGFHAAPFASAL